MNMLTIFCSGYFAGDIYSYTIAKDLQYLKRTFSILIYLSIVDQSYTANRVSVLP